LYVSYGSDFGKVVRFDPHTGAFKGVFASHPPVTGMTPAGLTFGPGGDLFVGDKNADQVLRFDGTSGAYEGVFASGGGLDGPQYLLFATIPKPASAFGPACAGLLLVRRRRAAVP
jgi:hypothetical protein